MIKEGTAAEKNTGTTFTLSSKKKMFFETLDLEEVPQIISSRYRYRRLYGEMYESQQKTYKSIEESERDRKIKNLRESITKRLSLKAERDEFNSKFGIKTERENKRLSKKEHENIFGLTHHAQEEKDLDNFLHIHPQAKQLEQLSRLTEFYLRDLDKVKTNTAYLNKLKVNINHRRIIPADPRRNKIFRESEAEYQKLRKINNVKHGKMLINAVTVARKNPSFRRAKNFKQIQFIIKQDNENQIAATEVVSIPQKQQYRNNLRRIFIQIAKGSQAQRAYYEQIEQKQFPFLCELLSPSMEGDNTETQVCPAAVKNMIDAIIKYKYKKVLHFEDFRELTESLQQKFQKYSTLEIILQKKPKILESELEKFQHENRAQIQKILTELKVPVAIMRLYEKYSQEIISLNFLSIKTLAEIMRSCRLIPQIISMSQFMYTCYWHKRRYEGFNHNEFLKIQVSLALSLECSLEGVKKFLRLLRPEQLGI